ncbi:hypothetical protein ACGTNG_12550 [Halomonas sp. 1390]|uniref:hypothetical protein n=1 Tax=Halomonas sp. B23F22_3 TaxID=3459516 RepID=UPI00373E7BC5
MRRCISDPFMDEPPKTLDERLRDGKSMTDGLAGRAAMHEHPLDSPIDQWNLARRTHGTTRGRHDDQH